MRICGFCCERMQLKLKLKTFGTASASWRRSRATLSLIAALAHDGLACRSKSRRTELVSSARACWTLVPCARSEPLRSVVHCAPCGRASSTCMPHAKRGEGIGRTPCGRARNLRGASARRSRVHALCLRCEAASRCSQDKKTQPALDRRHRAGCAPRCRRGRPKRPRATRAAHTSSDGPDEPAGRRHPWQQPPASSWGEGNGPRRRGPPHTCAA